VVKTLKFPFRFFKAQLASFTATLIDFSITYTLTSFAGQSYVFSSATGVVCGGIINFLLGRYWVFNANKEKKVKQVPKYILVWISSMLLNMGGLVLFTEVFGFYYLISKVITSTIVGIIFNYNIQRTFVFKTKDSI
jgi:putative flippase GtrA